ncbi:hypothetical protein PGTUg99_025052 [Puccinia graminis f. sp. tritici]|uniref:Secreted protein n=2 Tax=Puccinia graminis f. sp. tritici TaxID=56615 RepID=E3L568_PUCGT|nr:uncharacterized protein PGTG_17549 [Puccinia graminis f. sp. tritici CRL 75-36-700-3]EFP91693.2 hypothetical protein PGTG_17549 [Puccinia graminis f. sp. tritici CRL 75-36-700-3]KAA1130832.1 hypothetical protein PGTUg99_025052 [Puccinia graminis f. sp. tritici]
MRCVFFVIISVGMYAGYVSGDQTPIPSPNPGADTTSKLADNQQLPPPVPMECKNTYVPVSERDIAAIEKEDNANDPNKKGSDAAATPDADLSKLSDEQTMAICEAATDSKPGLCEIKSCKIPQNPVCTQCTELDKDSKDFTEVKGATPVDKIECDSGYSLKTPENKQKGNMCMTKEKGYMCAGDCQGTIACQTCYTDNKPANSGKPNPTQ